MGGGDVDKSGHNLVVICYLGKLAKVMCADLLAIFSPAPPSPESSRIRARVERKKTLRALMALAAGTLATATSTQGWVKSK